MKNLKNYLCTTIPKITNKKKKQEEMMEMNRHRLIVRLISSNSSLLHAAFHADYVRPKHGLSSESIVLWALTRLLN